LSFEDWRLFWIFGWGVSKTQFLLSTVNKKDYNFNKCLCCKQPLKPLLSPPIHTSSHQFGDPPSFTLV
jgi:hypothetical protein